MHRRQASGAGAPQQPQQKRLRLIVARVADGDAVGVEVRARAIEKLVTRRMRRVLDGAPLAGGAEAHVLALDQNRPGRSLRPATRQNCSSRSACGAKLMIEVREPGDRQFAGRLELAQQVRERHRIGAARQRDDDACPRSCQIVPADRAADGSIIHGWQGWFGQAGSGDNRVTEGGLPPEAPAPAPQA